MAAIWNMIPNLLWTALFLVPAAIFCHTFIILKTTSILLAVSLVPVFFPNSFFDRIQLSRNPGWYKKAGVQYINTFAQNGRFITKILRKKYPGFTVVSRNRGSIKKQFHQTYFFEKFHFSLFVFFTMITVYAALQQNVYWALYLTISNLLYNIYPNLLQQYIRVKLRPAMADR